MQNQPRSFQKRVATIIGNSRLAAAIYRALRAALDSRLVRLPLAQTPWDIFEHSLKSAIRDIENHPRGKLFRRLFVHGPDDPGQPERWTFDGETKLSDVECGLSVEFIYSHMVNRFKGELAELLAVEPVLKLVGSLVKGRYLPSTVRLYWGETIQQRSRPLRAGNSKQDRWGAFTKGADGLIVEGFYDRRTPHPKILTVFGIVEVKSMVCSPGRVSAQIDRHIARLKGGLKLQRTEWPRGHVKLSTYSGTKRRSPGLVRIVVVPSAWNLSREWKSVKNKRSTNLVFPPYTNPPVSTKIEPIGLGVWRIMLDWSKEALEDAAFNMTFWYMSQVGAHVYTKQTLPKAWHFMTPERAGRNAIKQALYFILVRHLTEREYLHAIRLYNVYGFGYPLGVDSKEILSPEDFPHREETRNQIARKGTSK